MEWISVNDQLPDRGVDVLVTDGDACMVSELDSLTGEFYFFNLPFWNHESVTHWKPLDELPKQ